MISDAAIEELKQRNPCDAVASRWVTLRRHGKMMIGPCPLHSPDPAARDSTAFECDAKYWVCAVCSEGGDVIKLLMMHESIDFRAAIEQLGGAAEPDAERAAELERERQAKRTKAAVANNAFRERERETVFEIWRRGTPFRGTPVQDYLELRGLHTLPADLRLRYLDDMPYYLTGAKDATIVHRGPCMLAPIVDAGGTFRALHMTWLDLNRLKGKAGIREPETGAYLPSKKVRGSKAAHVIRLSQPSDAPVSLCLGEGIETVLSVWLALQRSGRDLSGFAFWSSVDLGNIGGKSADSVPHPTLKDAGGKRRRVPGLAPAPDTVSIAIPDSVQDVVLLGDGDSDRFTTHCTLWRGAQRFTRDGRVVRVAWAPDGMDFNDALRGAA